MGIKHVLGTLIGSALGMENSVWITRIVAMLLGGGLVIYAFLGKEFRLETFSSRGDMNRHMLGGVVGIVSALREALADMKLLPAVQKKAEPGGPTL